PKEDACMTVDVATIGFYIIAIALVGSSLAVVLLRNIVRAALSLILVFGAAARVYVLLSAEFIAIVQVLVYAGAITVLILFAIRLPQPTRPRASHPSSAQWWLAGPTSVLLGAGVIYAVGWSSMLTGSASTTLPLAGVGPDTGTVVRLGQLLYSPFTYSYVLP